MRKLSYRDVISILKQFSGDLRLRLKSICIKLKPMNVKLKSMYIKLEPMRVKLQPLLSKLKAWPSHNRRQISWKSPKVIGGTLSLLLLMGGTASAYLNGTSLAANILVNGQMIGLVASVDKGQEMVADILAKRGQAVGETAKTHDQLEFEKVRVKNGELLNALSTEKELEKALTSYIEGYAIEIAGEQVLILPNQEVGENLLKAYQDYYTKPSEHNEILSAEFEEPVAVKPVEAQPEEVKLYAQAWEEFIYGRITVTEYITKENDSWWLIARKNDMLTKDVLAGNPGMTEDSKIQPGQSIKLVSVSPYLTVVSEGVLTATETVAYDVVTKTDMDLGIGKTVVQEEGSDGSKTVKYSYKQKNGDNIEKQVLEEIVTEQPVTRVIAKGPELTPVSLQVAVSRGASTGLAWPLRGANNSSYGNRSGGFHSGLDIGGSTGTPYYAAAAGKVVTAGMSGGYGYMILLDHGNGVVTRYAHSSKLLVTEGQQVSQGQKIGLVGSTGNSTGPHLHFEVILNGSTVNPANYLR